MRDISILAPVADEIPRNFSELDTSCGKFIDTWLDAGGEPTDEAILDFCGLWTQLIDARGKDEAGFFEWAYPLFIEARDKVRAALKAASRQS